MYIISTPCIIRWGGGGGGANECLQKRGRGGRGEPCTILPFQSDMHYINGPIISVVVSPYVRKLGEFV